MELKKKIVFILNPISGTANKTGIPYLIDTIIDKERFDCTTVFTERAGHASELAKKAAEEGADIVVAVGGDGTVNEVARGITDTKTALGTVSYTHLTLPTKA